MIRQTNPYQKFYTKMILKVCMPFVLQSEDRIKQATALSRITSLAYVGKAKKQKRFYCIVCKSNLENAFLVILHLQLQHSAGKKKPFLTQKYQIQSDTLNIYPFKPSKYQPAEKLDLLLSSGKQTYLFGSFKHRKNMILLKTFNKIIRKYQLVGEKKYFHSSNIYSLVGPDSEGEDSEAEIGKVQLELERLRIREFTDVNQNDKKFFIDWNNHMHEYKKKFEVIYPFHLKNVLLSFAEVIARSSSGENRLNLVMHLWTLCSLGQVTSEQVLVVLGKYDDVRKVVAASTEQKK